MDSNNKYKLLAEGVSGIIFKKEAEVFLNSKSFSILIQTDKGIYEPGDTLKFRVFLLDRYLKAAELKGSMNIYIYVSFIVIL